MKYKISIVLILTFLSLLENRADPVITFFMKPYGPCISHNKPEELSAQLQKPHKLAKKTLADLNTCPPVAGILSTYAGYLALSDAQGQTTFPKKHILPLVYLLITPKITPVLIAGNTIHHWEISEPHQAIMYKIERIHNEADELYYWNITKVPIPTNHRVPLESITILLKPSHVHVPEGISLTEESNNLILPSIFVKKGTKINTTALYMLNVRQFFGHSSPLYKKGTRRYMTLQT